MIASVRKRKKKKKKYHDWKALERTEHPSAAPSFEEGTVGRGEGRGKGWANGSAARQSALDGVIGKILVNQLFTTEDTKNN